MVVIAPSDVFRNYSIIQNSLILSLNSLNKLRPLGLRLIGGQDGIDKLHAAEAIVHRWKIIEGVLLFTFPVGAYGQGKVAVEIGKSLEVALGVASRNAGVYLSGVGEVAYTGA